MTNWKENIFENNLKVVVDEKDNEPDLDYLVKDHELYACKLDSGFALDLHKQNGDEHQTDKGNGRLETVKDKYVGVEGSDKLDTETGLSIEIIDCDLKPSIQDISGNQTTKYKKCNKQFLSKENKIESCKEVCNTNFAEGLHFGRMIENIYFLDEEELKEESEKNKQKTELLIDLDFGREQEIPDIITDVHVDDDVNKSLIDGISNYGAGAKDTHEVMNSSQVCENLFSYFPDELIVKIFSYLDTQQLCRHVMPVCKKWKQIAKEPSLWKTIDFNYNPEMESLSLLWVLRKAPLLRKLVLRGRSNITHPEIAILSEMCPLLTDVDFGFCDNLNCDMIQNLVENCQGLQKINVEGCDKIDHNCIKCLSKCKKLSHLNFSHCCLQDESVIYLADHLTEIISVNLDGWITDRGVSSLVSRHHDHLLNLELDGAEVTDAAIRNISTCKKLQSLEMPFCEYLSDDSLLFLKDLENLKVLKLRKGASFTKAGMSNFFATATFPHLEGLNLSECTCIDDSVVLDIAKCCGCHLTFLSLCWCWFITDTGLVSIVDHCGKLETLELLGIDKITGMCLDRVPEEIPNLTFLDLRQCNKIVDSLIVEVIRRKPDLKVLNYYGEEFVHI